MNRIIAILIGIVAAGLIVVGIVAFAPQTDERPAPTAVQPDTATLTLLAAGDIASCDDENDESTAKILDRYPDSLVLTLGDNVYHSGKITEYLNCYEPTWGRHKARTQPSIGNHDYGTAGGSDYFTYFGRSKPSYYSFDRGNWHFIALDSNCTIAPCSAGSAQGLWLKADLDKLTKDRCVLAYMHHPRISSGKHGNDKAVEPLWDILYRAKADIILSGHDHTYERFAPLAPDGSLDSNRGLRHFIVGTGGKDLYPFRDIQLGSAARNNTEHGVLKLQLAVDSFEWDFLPVTGGTFVDNGSAGCYKD